MTAFIWLDDQSNDDLGFVVKGTSKRPALPGTVDYTLRISGQNGQLYYGADMGPRQFVLDCAFMTRNAYELQQRAANLAAFLIDSYGKPRDIELRFRERPGQFFRVHLSGPFDITRIMGNGLFSISLVASDPFAYADLEQIFEDTVTISPYTTTVETNGNVRTKPVIVLINQGPSTIYHFKIENEYQVE